MAVDATAASHASTVSSGRAGAAAIRLASAKRERRARREEDRHRVLRAQIDCCATQHVATVASGREAVAVQLRAETRRQQEIEEALDLEAAIDALNVLLNPPSPTASPLSPLSVSLSSSEMEAESPPTSEGAVSTSDSIAPLSSSSSGLLSSASQSSSDDTDDNMLPTAEGDDSPPLPRLSSSPTAGAATELSGGARKVFSPVSAAPALPYILSENVVEQELTGSDDLGLPVQVQPSRRAAGEEGFSVEDATASDAAAAVKQEATRREEMFQVALQEQAARTASAHKDVCSIGTLTPKWSRLPTLNDFSHQLTGLYRAYSFLSLYSFHRSLRCIACSINDSRKARACCCQSHAGCNAIKFE
jgi:hypothetical protein